MPARKRPQMDQAQVSQQKKRRLWPRFAGMGVLVLGFVVFHYVDTLKPMPKLEDLKVLPADELKYSRNKALGASQYSMVFSDEKGNRYQTHYFGKYWADFYEDEVRKGGVMLYVGEEDTYFTTSKHFTIYQMTTGKRKLIDYQDRLEQKYKEEDSAMHVAALTVGSMGTILILAWLWERYRDNKNQGV